VILKEVPRGTETLYISPSKMDSGLPLGEGFISKKLEPLKLHHQSGSGSRNLLDDTKRHLMTTRSRQHGSAAGAKPETAIPTHM
jgi:hypothetical protein